jgi:hypothetical protein
VDVPLHNRDIQEFFEPILDAPVDLSSDDDDGEDFCANDMVETSDDE